MTQVGSCQDLTEWSTNLKDTGFWGPSYCAVWITFWFSRSSYLMNIKDRGTSDMFFTLPFEMRGNKDVYYQINLE